MGGSLPTWDMGFVCSTCQAHVIEAEKAHRQSTSAMRYWTTLGPAAMLFLSAYFGVMQLLLPHGPLLSDTLAHLSTLSSLAPVSSRPTRSTAPIF